MPPDALETLRQVNNNLGSALLRLRPEQRHCSTIRPQDFSDLLSEILRQGSVCVACRHLAKRLWRSNKKRLNTAATWKG